MATRERQIGRSQPGPQAAPANRLCAVSFRHSIVPRTPCRSRAPEYAKQTQFAAGKMGVNSCVGKALRWNAWIVPLEKQSQFAGLGSEPGSKDRLSRKYGFHTCENKANLRACHVPIRAPRETPNAPYRVWGPKKRLTASLRADRPCKTNPISRGRK